MLIKYFQAHHDYFWKWEDDAEVIAIPGGNTIAYRLVILDIVQKLSGQGLPPFNPLLLVLIALNPHGESDLVFVQNILKIHDKNNIGNSINSYFEEAFSFLNLLTTLPAKFKISECRIILLKTIFQDCHAILSLKQSDRTARLNINSAQAFLENPEFRVTVISFYAEMKVLALLNKKFPTIEDLLQKMAPIPELQEEINVEELSEPKDFIDGLIHNAKTQKVGALVKRIWSGLNIPFHSVAPSQQPIGGVSDLTNKGNFDQLLISEFANDDIVFLSRLANNEALYLRRESPPASNEMKRVILIDSSMRNWGTPKIISFATMLAIAKHPKNNIECEVFVVGKTVQPIQFETIEDLIDGIQIVEATLDASEGLEEFFTTFPSSNNRELFLLTERTAAQQAGMFRALNEYGEQINYLIYNDAEGQIDIYKKLKSSLKHVQHLEIPYEKLWQQNKRIKPNVEQRTPSYHDYYPILIHPSPAAANRIKVLENGEIFQVTKSKTLLRLFNRKAKTHDIGWEIICENIKISGNDFEIGMLKNGDIAVLTFNRQEREVRLLNVRTRVEKKIYFQHWVSTSGSSFVFHEEEFYHYNHKGCWGIDMKGENFFYNNEFKIGNIKEAFSKQMKRLEGFYSKFFSSSNILKNLKRVGINQAGNLVFNKHELKLNVGHHIKLDLFTGEALAIEAKYISNNFFQFQDGSTVELKKEGLIILNFANQPDATIFVPSVLGRSLGIATENKFAGNNYFFNEQLFEIILKDSGKEKINVIKQIKAITGFGLHECKHIIDGCPQHLLTYFTKKEILSNKKTLEELGAEIECFRTNSKFKRVSKMGANKFFAEYVFPFIQRIQNNGA